MVTKTSYIPDRGDLVWINFNPTRGHEQQGKRPALVLSPKTYNRKTGLLLACPVTRQIKGYPFEVLVDIGTEAGAILSDHLRSFDWQERKVRWIQKAPPIVTHKVLDILGTLLSK